jgi:hypothetical protein
LYNTYVSEYALKVTISWETEKKLHYGPIS